MINDSSITFITNTVVLYYSKFFKQYLWYSTLYYKIITLYFNVNQNYKYHITNELF